VRIGIGIAEAVVDAHHARCLVDVGDGAQVDGASNATLELLDPSQELCDRIGDHAAVPL
jgi:hypothetical protein